MVRCAVYAAWTRSGLVMTDKRCFKLTCLYQVRVFLSSHKQVDLVTGLNSGGYTEIIKGELNEGDQVISKITVETSQKKALRLF